MDLPHGEREPSKTYSMPDPDGLHEYFLDARRAVFPGIGKLDGRSPRVLTYEQAVALVTLAEGYLTLTMYELGQECCVGKLRDIWRARRATPTPHDGGPSDEG